MRGWSNALLARLVAAAAARRWRPPPSRSSRNAVHPASPATGSAPTRAGGSGFFGGFIDYLDMLNARDGGINGVKLTWEKCETEYNNARGVECYERLKNKGADRRDRDPSAVDRHHLLADRQGTADKIPIISIGYGRTDAADGRVFPYVFPLITELLVAEHRQVKFIGEKEGGMDKLKGKKIVNLYHDSAYGKETIPVLEPRRQDAASR